MPDDATDRLLVDGVAADSGSFTDQFDLGAVPTVPYAVAQIALSPGTHLLSSDVNFGVFENVYALAGFADPYLAVVPPVELSQDRYIFTTPTNRYARNFINVAVPSDAVASVKLDNQAIDPGFFNTIGNSDHAFARLAINPGVHEITADQPFGLLVYGYDKDDSYGYIGGFGAPSLAPPASVSISANTLTPAVGENVCLDIQVVGSDYQPLNDVPANITITGVHNAQHTVFTESNGRSAYCFLGYYQGSDVFEVTVGALTESLKLVWQAASQAANHPPVITSAPPVYILTGGAYSYDVDAVDPDGDVLSYNLVAAPQGMAIDTTTGEIFWRASIPGEHTITLAVNDPAGLVTEQSYRLVVNTLPVVIAEPETPYYNQTSYSSSFVVADADGDQVHFEILSGPVGWNIGYYKGSMNYGRVPDVGEYPFTVRITDSKGGYIDHDFVLTVLDRLDIPPPSFPDLSVANTAKVGHQYEFTMPVDNPSGQTISYSLIDPPAGASIYYTGAISWTPTESGVFTLTVRVTYGGDGFIEASWDVTVYPADTLLEAAIYVSPDRFVDDGTELTLSVVPSGAAGDTTVSLVLDGQPLALDGSNQAVITAHDIGEHVLVAQVADAYDSVTLAETFFVGDGADTTPPVVNIQTPANDTKVNAPISVMADVFDDNLVEWRLLVRSADDPDPFGGRVLASGGENGVVSGTLDPTTLVNGIYHLILEATDLNGKTASVLHVLTLDGNLKVGTFSFAVEDLNIPVAGIPVTVKRSYDSRRKERNLDYGFGWSVDYQDIRLEESIEPTQGWYQDSYNLLFRTAGGPVLLRGTCTLSLGTKKVTVTLPNGDVEEFRVKANITGGGTEAIDNPGCYMFPGRYMTLAFVAEEGTKSTLTNDETFYLSDLDNGNLVLIPGDTNPYPVTNYTLTTREGYIYALDQDFGVRQVTDPNGNTLTYSDAGILHSSGVGITFNRDGNGRITDVIDPSGNAIHYGYDTRGDLVSVTDQAGATTSYEYNLEHGLLNIQDPLGRSLVRNIYDDSGRLIAQEDNEGNRTDFNHDIAGRQSVVTDRRNNITIYYYDDEGNVTSQVDALNGLTEFTYDTNGNQLSKRDPNGNFTRATYNAEDDQLTQTDGLNNTVNFTYSSRGQELTIEDAKGNLFENHYDAVGNLLSITDPDLNVAGNDVNLSGQVTLTRDLAGNETTFTYDGSGNKDSETNPLLQVTTYTHDENGNVLTESQTRTVEGGAVATETTQYFYNALDQVERIVNKAEETTLKSYNSQGQLSQETNARSFVTDYEYDAYGRLVKTTYPDLTTELKAYDPNGNLISEIDRLQRETLYEYDALNRQTRITYFDGTFTQTEYDAAGRVTAEIDEKGNRTEYEYNAANQRIVTRDALLNETRFEYDANGNLISQWDANNQLTTFEYDKLDRRTKTIYPDTTFTLEGYDVLGRVISKTDQAGLITQYEYNALGQLTAVIDATNQRTEYTYDEAGNKLTQKDARLNTTSWSYDAMGRVLSRTLPEGQGESFTYDANGNQTSHTDFNGQTTTFIYDENDRLTEKSYPGAGGTVVETYTYDAVGNRTSSHDTQTGGTTTYDYDDRNRLTLETQPDGTTLAYGYDVAGNRTSVTTTLPTAPTPTVEITSYGYDSLNRLETVTDNNNQTTTYTYDNVGNRASVSYPNGNTTAYVYDTLNRLTQVQTKDSTNAVISQFDYTLGLTGRRDQITDLMGTISTYGYDDLYRLLREDITGHPVLGTVANDYQYDEVSNRTYATEAGVSTAYSYDNNDRLLTAGGETYVYDDNGNTLTIAIDAELTTHTYDANNRLTRMVKEVSGTVVDDVSYTYDLDGIRTAKNDDGVTTGYIVDKNRDYAQVLNEIDTSGNPQVSYVYGDDLIKQSRAANDSYYLYDGLGSTRALTDDTGQVTDTYDYSAYGAEIDSTGVTENSYKYTGEQFDKNLDNYYLRSRYYDPSNGRFTQQDTWMGNNSDPVTLHKYLYANGSPTNLVDPSGQFASIAGLGQALNILATLTAVTIYSQQSAVGSFAGGTTWDDDGFHGRQKTWILLAAMAGAGSKLLDLVTSKLGEDSNGNVIMYHGSSIDSLVSLLNGAPLSAASALEQKFPGEEGTLLGFYLTPDYDAADYFGRRRGGGVIQFKFTDAAFQAVRAGSSTRPIAPIGLSNQSPGTEMIVQPTIFPLFDSLRNSGQITVTPAN